MSKLIFTASSLLALTGADQSRYRPGGGAGAPVFGGGPAGGFSAGGFGGGFGGGFAGGASDAGNGDLSTTIPGTPGSDYPIFAEVPETSFLCDGQVDGGYYADVETDCQAFHICTNDGQGGLTKYSFLCPNGTLFQQQYFVCDWWFNVDCSLAESLYSLNEQVAAEREANSGGNGGAFGGQAGYGNGGRPSGAGGRPGGRPSVGRPIASAPAGYGSPAGYIRTSRQLEGSEREYLEPAAAAPALQEQEKELALE